MGDQEREMCDKVKDAVQQHLKLAVGPGKFIGWDLVEALTQVVAGTCWYFKVLSTFKKQNVCLWIKVFDQPWTQTLSVLGLLYNIKVPNEPLAYFDDNCEVAVGSSSAPQPVMAIMEVVESGPSPTHKRAGARSASALDGSRKPEALLEQVHHAEVRLTEIEEQIEALQAEKAHAEVHLVELRHALAAKDTFSITLASKRDVYTLEVSSSTTVRELKDLLIAAMEEAVQLRNGKGEKIGAHESTVDIFDDGTLIYGARSMRALKIGPGHELKYATRSTLKK